MTASVGQGRWHGLERKQERQDCGGLKGGLWKR